MKLPSGGTNDSVESLENLCNLKEGSETGESNNNSKAYRTQEWKDGVVKIREFVNDNARSGVPESRHSQLMVPHISAERRVPFLDQKDHHEIGRSLSYVDDRRSSGLPTERSWRPSLR